MYWILPFFRNSCHNFLVSFLGHLLLCMLPHYIYISWMAPFCRNSCHNFLVSFLGHFLLCMIPYYIQTLWLAVPFLLPRGLLSMLVNFFPRLFIVVFFFFGYFAISFSVWVCFRKVLFYFFYVLTFLCPKVICCSCGVLVEMFLYFPSYVCSLVVPTSISKGSNNPWMKSWEFRRLNLRDSIGSCRQKLTNRSVCHEMYKTEQSTQTHVELCGQL